MTWDKTVEDGTLCSLVLLACGSIFSLIGGISCFRRVSALPESETVSMFQGLDALLFSDHS